jgi:hypothetical protein
VSIAWYAWDMRRRLCFEERSIVRFFILNIPAVNTGYADNMAVRVGDEKLVVV